MGRMEAGPPEHQPDWTELADGKAQRTRGARRAWGVVIGLAGAFGLTMLIGGVVLIAVHGFLRDDEGFYNAGERDLRSPGYAITSGELDLGEGTVGVDVQDLAAALQFRIEGTEEQPVFVGVGPAAEVDRYLSGVAQSKIVDFTRRDKAIYDEQAGGPPPSPPSQQTFWAASSEGSGEQRIAWEIQEGEWIAVAMNADASRGIGIDGNAGVEVSWLLWLGVGLAAVGLVVTILSGFGLNRLWRS